MRTPPLFALRSLALSAMMGCAPDAQAVSLSGFAEGVLNPTMDAAEKVSNWKDGGPEALRYEQCALEGGEWVENLSISGCEQGMAELDADGVVTQQTCGPELEPSEAKLQCVHRDNLGQVYFNDGPSVPPAMLTLSSWVHDGVDQMRYNRLFWPAGVLHDHCYHGNPITYGLTQQDCDERFVEDLTAICSHHEEAPPHWFSRGVCHTYAALMYGMVRTHGADHFDDVNLLAYYEQPLPMWQQYGMAESPYTEARQQEVIDMLVKFKIMSDPKSND